MNQATSTSPQLRSRRMKMVPQVDVITGEPTMDEKTVAQHFSRSAEALSSGDHQAVKTLTSTDKELRDGDRNLKDSKSTTSLSHQGEDSSGTKKISVISKVGFQVSESDSNIDDDREIDHDRQPLIGTGDRRMEEVKVVLVDEEEETWMSIMLQVLLPYLIAGFGMVAAGMVLDLVQHSPVFTTVSELFILVPALLGLKGNLEMTLASRLSTQANLGNMDTTHEKLKMIFGNLVLVQAQATVVGFLGSMFAMVMGWIPKGEFSLEHALLLCASSLFTAAVASFLLGSLMAGVVLLSRKMNVNPDNIATPIAASLGDLITLALLAGVSSLLYSSLGKTQWMPFSIIAIFFLLLPVWVTLSIKNKYTNDVIYSGWTPVLSAMVISSLGGVILDFAVSTYSGIAVFQPVINGVGGNLVAVQASRISTYLHRRGHPGEQLAGVHGGCANPLTFFCGKSVNAKAGRVLLLLVIPGHLTFVCAIYYMKGGHTSITPIFLIFYLLSALLQVILLLYISQWMVYFIWSKGEDPDNSAIPYLTAIGDLLGTAFLAMAFYALYLLGDRDADIGD